MKKVGIVGAQGYTGLALAQLLNQHPKAELTALFTTQTDWHISHDLPIFGSQTLPHYNAADINKHAADFDVLFLATPPAVSIELINQLRDHTVTIIDLSGAFRLPVKQFEQTYQIPHTAPDLLHKTIYGLSPWWTTKHTSSQLIANPGCYATCALMTLLPLLKANLICPDNIIIDAKSGVSGAGRQAKKNLLFAEVHENFYPYKVQGHQHIPEIQQHIGDLAHVNCTPMMITHLLPITRGISMSVYTKPAKTNLSDRQLETAIATAYQQSYANYPLIKVNAITGKDPLADHALLSLKGVVRTPNTKIGYLVKQGHIIAFACIDNLLKGAASQAIENFNILSDLPVQTGLLTQENA